MINLLKLNTVRIITLFINDLFFSLISYIVRAVNYTIFMAKNRTYMNWMFNQTF